MELTEKRKNLKVRSRVIAELRSILNDIGYDEVQTPILQICPTMDMHIHGFKTSQISVDRTNIQDRYLHTSPELDMKKLIASGAGDIYQICPVFRNSESSRLHMHEFTMLEWYRVGEDYTLLMNELEVIIRDLCNKLDINEMRHQGRICFPFEPWQRLSVFKAFVHYADIDLELVLADRDAFAVEATAAGVRTIDSDKWDDIFHAVMADKIEPFLGLGRPTILYDYPISMAALSRKKKSDERVAERFEMYICGVEIANAFSELTDPIEQRKRFDEDMILKEEIYGERYPADEIFFTALETLPDCAGIALGVDRLIMLLCNAADIKDVQWL